ncbi:DEAD/DEAH box helicase [Vagococcus sp. BWB3-3]|uniref:DEAD/DEAH box helicase n=1 Tax=Vagococcus allomyrinae TaxID=2794353 RepID=A0A940P9A9_9ENTE|nr:DEAD/DEAH box helicase [Vagococcus allomyrinae]MBP1043702.1 DEAD/DEAH box helicase [Vagococcus allomyrinae]
MEFVTNLPQPWQTYWNELGYQAPSVIQARCYEALMAQENVVGVSPTGSGKTVAYLLPLLQQVKLGEGNQLLILLPSQELAVQVASVAKSWAELIGIKVQSLIGGANVKRQVEKLKEKPEVLVGTPGRVHELIKAKKVKAHLIKMIVLDEVDQLIEVSELNATKHILKAVSNDSQLVCVSATAVDIQERLAESWSSLTVIDVTAEDQSAGNVSHGFIRVAPRKRLETLKKLAFIKGFKGIVFFNELQEMGSVADKLAYQGVPNVTLASDQNKLERKLALSAFAEDKVSLLLTTDIAARGLDFVALPFVLHYDVPYSAESYTHRSGRTGRMGNDGTVLAFAGDYELKDLKKVAKGYQLTELSVHSSQLVPVTAAMKEEALKNKKVEGKIEQPATQKNRAAAKGKTKEPRKHKKKDQKNKGARKAKQNSNKPN